MMGWIHALGEVAPWGVALAACALFAARRGHFMGQDETR